MTGAATAEAEPGRRPPPGNPRFPLLDGVRAIAALSVVGVHLADASGFSSRPVLGELATRLNVGVAIFFVLSGFLLYRPFAAARLAGSPAPGLLRYMRRRALRILPAYWAALALCALLGWIVMPGGWWRYVLFGQTFSLYTIFGGINPAWTLCIEVIFYITLPLWALLVAGLIGRRAPGRQLPLEVMLVAALGLAGIAFRAAAAIDDPHSLWLVQFPAHLTWFAGGMLLALLSISIQRRGGLGDRGLVAVIAARPWIAWTAAFVLYLLASFALGLPPGLSRASNPWQNVGQHLLYLGVALAVTLPAVLAAHAPGGKPRGAVERLLATPLVGWLGLVSYGIFLWHHPLLTWLLDDVQLTERAPVLPMVVLSAVTVAGSVTLGAASYYLVERPFLRLKERRPGRSPSSAG